MEDAYARSVHEVFLRSFIHVDLYYILCYIKGLGFRGLHYKLKFLVVLIELTM